MTGAVLIIGSLYWDKNEIRNAWRQDRLATAAAAHVKAPIRYGRISPSRGKTPTMVLSLACYRAGRLGVGLAVPFSVEPVSKDTLWDEAVELWRAEANHRTTAGICDPSWGCVGLLANPRASDREKVKAWWSQAFRTQRASPIPPIDGDGFLALRWPRTLNGQPLPFDFLIATATKPTPPDRGYFLPREIAALWLEGGHQEYFLNNAEHGIVTYQDAAIWRCLVAARPAWLQGRLRSVAPPLLDAERRR